MSDPGVILGDEIFTATTLVSSRVMNYLLPDTDLWRFDLMSLMGSHVEAHFLHTRVGDSH